MDSELSHKLSLIVENDEIQSGFELEKELKGKNEYLDLFYKLENYLLPWISSAQFENLMQNNLLDLLRVQDIDLKERINLRIIPFPEESQDFEKIDYLRILLKNKENIGKFPLSQWLKNYEEFVAHKKGTNMDRTNFFDKNQEAKILPNEEKNVLIKVLDLFDFVKPNFSYTEYLKKPMENNQQHTTTKKFQANTSAPLKNTKEKETKLENLTLSDALKKYPELGEQLITSQHIKLQNFPEPVRPSIKNWLSNYTFTMGYSSHSTMARGEFIFQNENTKILSHQDRQKLTYILKAFDENTAIEINVNLKQVAFPKTSSPESLFTHKKDSGEKHQNTTADITAGVSHFGTSQNSETPAWKHINSAANFKQTSKSDWQKEEDSSEPKDIFQSRKNETRDFFKKPTPVSQPISDLNSQKNTINKTIPTYTPPKPQEPLKKSFTDGETTNLKFTSPQRMPFENHLPAPKKNIEKNPVSNTPQPLIITPGAFERNHNDKNVVNLKE